MRKTRSRGTKRHVKRHTRRRGGENSPNPAAGAPAKINKKPTINLNKLHSNKYRLLGQIPGNNGPPTDGSVFPLGEEGFAFPNRTAAPNTRIKNIQKRAKEIKEERKRVNNKIKMTKERESLKKYYEDELRAMEEKMNRLKKRAAAAKEEGDTNEEERIQKYIQSMNAEISYKKDKISELENNNEEGYENY